MKLPTPASTRLLALARVICASEAAKEFSQMQHDFFPDDKLRAGLKRVGLNATLDEYRLLVQSLHEIFSLGLTNQLSAERAAKPFDGLTVEREVELLQEIISRKLAPDIINKHDVFKGINEAKKKRLCVAVDATAEELAYMAIVAVNAHAARFQAELESKF